MLPLSLSLGLGYLTPTQLIRLPLSAQMHSHLHVQGYCLSWISALSSHMCRTFIDFIMHTPSLCISPLSRPPLSQSYFATPEGGLLTTDNVPCGLVFSC